MRVAESAGKLCLMAEVVLYEILEQPVMTSKVSEEQPLAANSLEGEALT
jgi:hypothetical protein